MSSTKQEQVKASVLAEEKLQPSDPKTKESNNDSNNNNMMRAKDSPALVVIPQSSRPQLQVNIKPQSDAVHIQKRPQPVNIGPKSTCNKIPLKPLVPLAPLAPKKQILPKLLPAQPKHGSNNQSNGIKTSSYTTVNTSKQWVLPPRPRPGRKSTDSSNNHNNNNNTNNSSAPTSTIASPATSSSSPPPLLLLNLGTGNGSQGSPLTLSSLPSSSGVVVTSLKKAPKVRKTLKNKKSASVSGAVAAAGAGATTAVGSSAMMPSTSLSATVTTTTTSTGGVSAKKLLDSKGNFELKLQLQNATEENENLRKIINKLNREIDLLKLAKMENKSHPSKMRLVPRPPLDESSVNNSIVNDLSTTIDPLKINCNLKSKRMKRFSSDSRYKSSSSASRISMGIGLNGNSLDDAGFYNADTLMPTDLLLNTNSLGVGTNKKSINKTQNNNNNNISETDDLKPKEKGMKLKYAKLAKSKSLPLKNGILKNLDFNNNSFKVKNELCGFCSNGSPCVCYESTLDLLQNRDNLLPITVDKLNLGNNFLMNNDTKNNTTNNANNNNDDVTNMNNNINNLRNLNNNNNDNIFDEPNMVKLEDQMQVIPPQQLQEQEIESVLKTSNNNNNNNNNNTGYSRTTDIIGDLGRNFIKNELDVDMSFFVKPEEQDVDEFMMM